MQNKRQPLEPRDKPLVINHLMNINGEIHQIGHQTETRELKVFQSFVKVKTHSLPKKPPPAHQPSSS